METKRRNVLGIDAEVQKQVLYQSSPPGLPLVEIAATKSSENREGHHEARLNRPQRMVKLSQRC